MKPQQFYLLIGQSNMAGRGEITESEREPLSDVLLFDDQENWIPADNPLNRFSTTRKKIEMQHLGPGYGFAREIRSEHADLPIGLVVNARGGTSIRRWQRGEDLYDAAMKRARAALNDASICGILWHQGENDSDDPEYLPKLITMIGQLREDFENPSLPFVAGHIFESPALNAQLDRLPAEVPHCAVASSEGLTCFDGLHFDTSSALLLGQRYAAQLKTLLR